MQFFQLDTEHLRAWCERRNLRFLYNEKLDQMMLPRGDQEAVRVIPHKGRGMVTFALPVPVEVPEARYDEVARAAALANSSSFMGAWVLNAEKGEVYFRLTLPAVGTGYTDDGLAFALRVVLSTYETLEPAFRSVIAGEAGHRAILEAQQSGS